MIPQPEQAKSGGESQRHRQLKLAAHFWAQQTGYRVSAMEVSLPRCRFRADVAAYRPNPAAGPALPLGDTAVFECKQSRADFLCDCRSERAALEKLAALRSRLAGLKDVLKIHHPTLRTGETLFPEFDRYDFSEIPHNGLRTLIREIRILESRAFAKTKFDKLVRYKCANAFYLVVYDGLVDPGEVPASWGLLAMPPDAEPSGTLDLVRKPARIPTDPHATLEFLHRLAATATRETNRLARRSFGAGEV